MGVSISYKGYMAQPDSIDEMVRDLQAMAERMEWRTWTMDELTQSGHVQTPDLRGITIAVHPKCEPVHLHIDSAGQFVNHRYYTLANDEAARAEFCELMSSGRLPQAVGDESAPAPSPASDDGAAKDLFFGTLIHEGMSHNWSKTQFGGVEAHIQTCALLRHVRDHYAPALEVTDDTGFFKHGRREALEQDMGYIDRTLGMMKLMTQGVADVQIGVDVGEPLKEPTPANEKKDVLWN